jgi:hypothetical protein
MEEIRYDLWRWTEPHPDWTAEEDWEQDVAAWQLPRTRGCC